VDKCQNSPKALAGNKLEFIPFQKLVVKRSVAVPKGAVELLESRRKDITKDFPYE
jgi:hypothetical protein